MSKPKTLCPYYGGKSALGTYIASRMPEHRHYLELFGGMCGTLMAKRPSFTEVYNDLNGSIVTLMRVVRNKPDELISLLELTPYARDEWKYCRENYKTETNEVERARMVYVMLSMGYVGSLGNKSFSFGGLKYTSSPARNFVYSLPNISQVAERLKNVVIENQDWITLAERYDDPDTLIYLDPPYLPETRKTKNDYANELSPAGHKALLEWCLQAESKIIISGYWSELYHNQLTKAGWFEEQISAQSQAAKSTGKCHKRVECLWYSPNCQANQRHLFNHHKAEAFLCH